MLYSDLRKKNKSYDHPRKKLHTSNTFVGAKWHCLRSSSRRCFLSGPDFGLRLGETEKHAFNIARPIDVHAVDGRDPTNRLKHETWLRFKYQLARWISSINSRTSRQKKSRNVNLQKYLHRKGMLHCGEWHGCWKCYISIMSHVRLRLPSSRAPCARTAASSILFFFVRCRLKDQTLEA